MTLVDVFKAAPWLFVAGAVLIGLAIGSFLNVVIHRLPRMLERQWRTDCADLTGAPAPTREEFNLAVPRSACPACGHRITALENIPVVSWLALRGRCAACKARISPRYPLVEALTGALAGYAVWRFGVTLAALGAIVFSSAMIALAFINLETSYLPDAITIPLLWAGLLFNLDGTFIGIGPAVVGAAGAYCILLAASWVHRYFTGGAGVGRGDMKLLAAMGAWFGWKGCVVAFSVFAIVGALFVAAAAAVHSQAPSRPRAMPTGFLWLAAGLTTLFLGERWEALVF